MSTQMKDENCKSLTSLKLENYKTEGLPKCHSANEIQVKF